MFVAPETLARFTWEALVDFLTNLQRHGRNPEIERQINQRLDELWEMSPMTHSLVVALRNPNHPRNK